MFALWLLNIERNIRASFLREPPKNKLRKRHLSEASDCRHLRNVIVWTSFHFRRYSGNYASWAPTTLVAFGANLELPASSTLSNYIIKSMTHQREKVLNLLIFWFVIFLHINGVTGMNATAIALECRQMIKPWTHHVPFCCKCINPLRLHAC